MKFLSLAQIEEALEELAPFNPFFGSTFLVLKQAGVPIGRKQRFALDQENERFLVQYYRANPQSQHFFKVFRKNTPDKDWVRPDYSGKGLQKLNTTTFAGALLHDFKENTWGWHEDYIDFLASKLPPHRRLPAFHIAAWLYRDASWNDDATREDLVEAFLGQFRITPRERERLLTVDVVSGISEEAAFQQTKVRWHRLLNKYETPPDVPPERSGALSRLDTSDIGPIQKMRFSPGVRLTLVTGDNGLGKTFLLDLAWYALTGSWSDRQAIPANGPIRAPKMSFLLSGGASHKPGRANYDSESFAWNRIAPTVIPGLTIYARVDGSFCVFDPLRPTGREVLKMSRDEVWDGTKSFKGLIDDWVMWQTRPDKLEIYETFQRVLRRMYPPDMGELDISPPSRIADPDEPREIPVLKHPYGEVPILFESAGVKRMLGLVYLVVAAWEEHKAQAQLRSSRQESQMIILLDEAESHLHPRWQRVLLPALLDLANGLRAELELQTIVATHSPMVMASSEPIWDEEQDRLYHLSLSQNGQASLDELVYVMYGNADSWLRSPVFDLNVPGSTERERAIMDAKALQLSSNPAPAAVREVDERLRTYLPPEDEFWIRWLLFAEENGVDSD